MPVAVCQNVTLLSLPSVILCIEQEVGAYDGDTDGDDSKDDEDKEHEAIHIVDLVCPE